MSDEYIEKEDAIQSIIAHDLVGGDARGWAEYLLENTSTADVAPVRHAHWVLLAPIYNSDGLPTFPVKCSRKECGEIAWRRTDYCPNCGAKMDEEER